MEIYLITALLTLTTINIGLSIFIIKSIKPIIEKTKLEDVNNKLYLLHRGVAILLSIFMKEEFNLDNHESSKIGLKWPELVDEYYEQLEKDANGKETT